MVNLEWVWLTWNGYGQLGIGVVNLEWVWLTWNGCG